MSEPQPPIASATPAAVPNLLLAQLSIAAFGVLILLFCWSAFVWLGVRPLVAPSQPPKENPDDPGTTPKSGPERKSPAVPVQQTAAVNQSRLAAYENAELQLTLNLQRTMLAPRLNSLKLSVDQVNQLKASWKSRLDQLMTNTEGKRLATEELASNMKILNDVLDSKMPIAASVSDWLTAIQEILKNARGPISDIDGVESRLLENESSVAELLATFEHANEARDKMLTVAASAQDRTLQEALNSLQDDAERAVRDGVAQQIAELESRQADAMGAAENEKSQLMTNLIDAERRFERVTTESAEKLGESQRAVEADAKRVAEQRAELRRQMEAELPAMKSLLSPFINSGYRQPSVNTTLEITAEAAPMSLNALQRVRALEDSKKSLEILLMLADADASNRLPNDRPLGTFPNHESEFDIQKPQVVKTLQTVQQFLRKYGDVMVDAKLLSP